MSSNDTKKEQCSAALPVINNMLGDDPSAIEFTTIHKAPHKSSSSVESRIVDPDTDSLTGVTGRVWTRIRFGASGKKYFEDIEMSSEDKVMIQNIIKRGLGNSINSCPELKRYIRYRGSSFGSTKIRPVRKLDSDRMYAITTGYISLPILSSDGAAAYVVSSSVSGLLVGGGALIKLTKDKDGVWREFGGISLWIS